MTARARPRGLLPILMAALLLCCAAAPAAGGRRGRRRLAYAAGFPWEPGVVNGACSTAATWYAELRYASGAGTASPCFTLWTDPGQTGASISSALVTLGGGNTGTAMTSVVAMGLEIGTACAASVAGATLAPAGGAAAARAVAVRTDRATGVLNVTAGDLNYDLAGGATLCLSLQAPCASLPQLCTYGGGTSCGSWVLLFPYRTKGACTGNCPNDRQGAWYCRVRDTPHIAIRIARSIAPAFAVP
ncbi:hypothetical protein Rsub_04544 [Raphidocelis subcapitata]|uniref:Pherophorin domain-containing protein n=1 Tax=Raphidocelis subcapitata TaxID=307507 RepID=A0A2V0P3L1_9CHLO|nr:hypothetical protein Rsub_04544 [Raphidocelis subcapitata]|eukprot:GBF92440.1 hypothetical protein Rsub_04544 [Raphidocelis subcapitata]